MDLIEATGRKAAVIARLAQAARLDNARAVTARAEEWAATPAALGGGGEAYDAVTARAVAALAVLVEYAAPLLRTGGVLVAWKGARDAEEEARGGGAPPSSSGWRSGRCCASSRSRAPATATCTCSARSRPRRSASRAGPGWRRSGRWVAARPRRRARFGL